MHRRFNSSASRLGTWEAEFEPAPSSRFPDACSPRFLKFMEPLVFVLKGATFCSAADGCSLCVRGTAVDVAFAWHSVWTSFVSLVESNACPVLHVEVIS